MTIPDLLEESIKRHRENLAFHYFDGGWKTLSYLEFGRSVSSISAYLAEAITVKKGDRVAIISENRPEWCMAYAGIVEAGAVGVPIDAQLGEEETRNLLSDSGATFVIFSEKNRDKIPVELKGLNIDSDLFKEVSKQGKGKQRARLNTNDLASIIYTSGTTGRPKGVMLSHRNFCSDAMAAIEAGIVSSRDNVLSILPLHHTYPFMCTFLVPLLIGASITYPISLKGTDLLSTIKDRGVTVLVGVPQVLEIIRNSILKRFDELPFPLSKSLRIILEFSNYMRRKADINIGRFIFRSVHKRLGLQFRFFTSGGARLDPAVFADLEALGFTVLEGYGLSETSPIVTFNPIKKRKPGSVGRPLPSVEIKILNPSESGEGEIAIRGPMVMEGYYKNPEETSKTIVDGWLKTGDLGYLDREGYLFITGRIKEVIVLSSGKNIYPDDVEKEYLKIPLIKEICVFGVEKEGGIESLQGIIVPDFDYARRERIGNIYEALKWEISQASMRLPPYMRIKGFTIYTEPLPRTALGKLKRYLIKEIYQSLGREKRKEEDPRLRVDEVGEKVARSIKHLLRGDVPLRLEDNLELDLGFDSLKRIELVAALEDAFGLKLPETFASEVMTVGDLIERIKEEMRKGPAEVMVESKRVLERMGLHRGVIERALILSILCLLKTIFKTLFRLEVRGISNLPDHPFIIAPNHSSYLDGFVVAAAVPYRIFKGLYFQGFQRYFTGSLSSFFARLARVIPIDPERYLSKAIELSTLLIKKGFSLCIFPEGGRTFDGNIMEFKKGVGLLSIKNNIPVVPTLIEGTYSALPRGAWFPRFSRIRITFGSPLYPSNLDFTMKSATIDEYQFLSKRLREEVLKLKEAKGEEGK